ncbi:MAG: LptF/LptG family permease [Spirochaetes bacterium]|nr:LptF/LptG family permease [Spirochaetota bacterium]
MRVRIISRYVIAEAIGPFFVGLFFFTFIFFAEALNRVIRQVVERGAPFTQALELFLYMMPFNLAITLPMGVLMGSLMAYGRLSGDSEIVAMKASGLSIVSIYKPIAIFGVVFFAFMLFFNDVILPEGNYRYRAMFYYVLNMKPSVAVEERRFMALPDTTQRISASKISGNIMSNVTIYDESSPTKRVVITATKGEWVNNKQNAQLINLHLENGMLQETETDNPRNATYTPFKDLTINLSRNIVDVITEHHRSDLESPSWVIKKRMVEGKKHGMSRGELNEHNIEYQKRFSLAFACLIFTLLGGPLGTVSRRSGKGVGFGISIAIIFIYYIFMVLGQMLGRSGVLPAALGMWVPNIVLGVTGAVLFYRLWHAEGK